jgi:hypothetical protein
MTVDNRTIDNEVNLQEIVDKPLGGKANIVLDATMLSTLMACPRLADFRFNLNLQSISGKSNSLEVGSVVHKFLEVYYGAMIQGISREQALGYGLTAAELYVQGCQYCTDFTSTPDIPKPPCGHRPNDYPGVVNTPKESEGYLVGWNYALKTCEQYHEFYRADHWVPLEVEIVKGKILYEDDEVRIMWKAKLDWVADTNQDILPIDHKTMKVRRPTLSLNNQFIGQCLIMGTRKMVINKIGFQSSLKPEEKFTRTMMSYSAPRLIEWQSEILPYYAKLLLMYAESGYFPPNYNACEGKYGNCAFHTVCSSDPEMREEELKINFKVGPVWNPTNEAINGDE